MLKRIIFFLVIFSLPFQLGYHFWLPQSFVKSFRLDYLSPTFYLTDAFILLYLCLNFKKPAFTYVRLALLGLIAINIIISSFNPITILAWLRLLSYFLLFTTLAREENLSQKVSLPFKLSLIIILILELAQLFLQHSLGGPLWLLGERPLSIAAPNVAKIVIGSTTLLRPYAAFSHPNSLAGYLLVSLLLLPVFSNSKFLKYLLIVGIILTFSKAALLALFFPYLILTLPLNFLPLVGLFVSLPNWLVQSFSSRISLLLVSVKLLSDRWAFGVGLRQFIPSLAKTISPNQLSYTTLQPVHNLLLLVLVEIGFLPLIIILIILYAHRHSLNSDHWQLLAIILITGSLDHYWWTLPQNQLIIVLALALLTNKSNLSN